MWIWLSKAIVRTCAAQCRSFPVSQAITNLPMTKVFAAARELLLRRVCSAGSSSGTLLAAVPALLPWRRRQPKLRREPGLRFRG